MASVKNLVKPFFHTSRRVLAKLWMQSHSKTTVIGITGSYGKTNTTMAIKEVLGQKFKVLATDVNLDTNFNIPITILKMTDQEKLILEYGVDHIGEMDRHLSLARPNIAVITGIAPVHADRAHLGSLENIIIEKRKLVEALPKEGWAVLNNDVPSVRHMADNIDCHVMFYSLNKNSGVWANRVKVDFSGLSFNLHYKDQMVKVKTSLIGRHHVLNCLAAAAVGIISGMSLSLIAKGLSQVEPLEGRMSVEVGPRGSVLLNDARRANPASTIAGLEALDDLPAKRKIAVLGEMAELGDWEEKGHREVGEKVGEIKPTYLIAVGPKTRFIAEEAEKKMKKGSVIWVNDVFEAVGVLTGILKKGDLMYLKGSLLRHLERIPLIMEGKQVDSDDIALHRYEVYR